jgi:hypothetical protein
MRFLDDIPEDDMLKHDEAGTLGDSDEITEKELKTFDNQLKRYGLEVVWFENGSALEWFIEPNSRRR